MATPVDRITRLEVKFEDLERRVEGNSRTLYGANGNGGLQADVYHLILSQNNFTKATGESLDKLYTAIAGGDDFLGLAHEVKELREAEERRQYWFRVVIGVALTEAVGVLAGLIALLIRRS